MNQKDLQLKIDKLAKEILDLSRSTLLLNLRFLDTAIYDLRPIPMAQGSIYTDGQFLFYNPVWLLQCYKAEQESVARNHLHIILHCVFHHAFVGELMQKSCWDLACDMAVENAISELMIPAVKTKRQGRQQEILDSLRGEIKKLTAEKIYRYFLEKKTSEKELEHLREVFLADDHERWYQKRKEPTHGGEGKGKQGSGKGNTKTSQQFMGEGPANGALTEAEIKDKWKKNAERAQVDLETTSKQWAKKAGGMLQNLKEVNREKYDYAGFLARFATLGEVMQINDDEFDYVFYTYGLKLYEKMPLIEPLEYKETKRIKEFVIAIDTSGSVQGAYVQKFVQKTYNILKQSENFFTKINLHIIQCDAEVQEDAVITTQEEFDAYIANMQLRGFGGTDFRPVFRYVNELIEQKQFTDLKGLIYFTDGYGTFPEREPDYKTAFVFLEDEDSNTEVPSWAIRLVLSQDEL